MIKRIKTHLTKNPSYLKWGAERIAEKFGCSVQTAKRIKKELYDITQSYRASLVS